MIARNKGAAVLLLTLFMGMPVSGQDTLPISQDGWVPQTYEELWAGFDPRAEPLDVEVLKEWEEDGVVLKVLRYRIGIFKGQKAMMAGVYGYPKGGSNLPGLVQIHGGGQYADYQAPLTNGKRGYASISLSWGGRISAPGYRVSPNETKLFWEGKTEDPDYKIITDWGALDAYHAPSRNPGNQFPGVKPAAWTLDTVDSPRNCPWFLCTIAARRALTFLEQQPEVDGGKLGVYGHSMGGKITVLTAGSDDRVKAAAPSCGGISDRSNKSALFRATLGDDIYLQHMTCPIVFLSPANDFHGRIDDLQAAVQEIKAKDWRVTCAAHHNHQDTANYEVATQIWFDQVLKGTFQVPATPGIAVSLDTANGVPSCVVKPDAARPIVSVDVFYTRHGRVAGEKDDMANTKARFWHHVAAVQDGDGWTADLPLSNVDQPLWVYANVVYELDEPISGAGYYYRVYTTDEFTLSSRMEMYSAHTLKAAGVRATVQPSLLIEAFDEGWEKEWFTYRPEQWGRSTHKLYDAQWKAAPAVKLGLEVRSVQPNKLVVGIDGYAAEVDLGGGPAWQQVTLAVGDFKNAGAQVLSDWNGKKELRLGAAETLKEKVFGEQKTLKVGGTWQGGAPVFRNLRWIETVD